MGPCFSLEKHICVSSGILCESSIQRRPYFSLESEELHSKLFPYIYVTGDRRPHTTVYMSSYHYVCVLMLLYVSSYTEGFLCETNLCLFSLDPSCDFSPTTTDLGDTGFVGVTRDMNPESLRDVRHDSSMCVVTHWISHATCDMTPLHTRHPGVKHTV